MKELLNRLNAIQEQYEFSDAQLCSKIGITPDELYLLRNNRLSDPLRLQFIQRFVEMMQEKIYPTKLLNKMENLFTLTHKEQAITIVGSISGGGKTLASERFSNANTYAVYLYIPEIITPRHLLALICQKLALPWSGLNLQQLYEQIIGSLAQEKKLLIFDEADRLNKKMFEIMRDIWSDGKGNVGLVFVGDENLMNKIKRPGTLRDNLIRLMRRVKYNEILDPLHPDDVKMVFKTELGKHKITDDMIKAIFNKYCKLGGFGSIRNLTDKISKIAKNTGDQPNNEMAEEAIKRLKI
ncbi:MAG TPA: ATP-binding protein [Ignavibacteria bacterium]|nr:ATP-binding protein [Ignavibacteria bacterium]